MRLRGGVRDRIGSRVGVGGGCGLGGPAATQRSGQPGPCRDQRAGGFCVPPAVTLPQGGDGSATAATEGRSPRGTDSPSGALVDPPARPPSGVGGTPVQARRGDPAAKRTTSLGEALPGGASGPACSAGQLGGAGIQPRGRGPLANRTARLGQAAPGADDSAAAGCSTSCSTPASGAEDVPTGTATSGPAGARPERTCPAASAAAASGSAARGASATAEQLAGLPAASAAATEEAAARGLPAPSATSVATAEGRHPRTRRGTTPARPGATGAGGGAEHHPPPASADTQVRTPTAAGGARSRGPARPVARVRAPPPPVPVAAAGRHGAARSTGQAPDAKQLVKASTEHGQHASQPGEQLGGGRTPLWLFLLGCLRVLDRGRGGLTAVLLPGLRHARLRLVVPGALVRARLRLGGAHDPPPAMISAAMKSHRTWKDWSRA